ncbi:unannotated protein [freshwater metagenome]|uniref:Unannotated protein n=1 Tax=freshwater metagenome TaxID=449393 RepID=A0A6J6Q7H5_9ZZZZ
MGGSSRAPSLRGKNSYQAPKRARRRCTLSGHGPLVVNCSRIGVSFIKAVTLGSTAAARRTAGGSEVFRIAVIADIKSVLVTPRWSKASAWSNSKAPSVNSSSISSPAKILIFARRSHVRQGSPQASIVKVQWPISFGRMMPAQVSMPAGSRNTLEYSLPSGRCSTAASPRVSWPSRKQVARTRTASSTAAAAGRRPLSTDGLTSVMANRPTNSGGTPKIEVGSFGAAAIMG